ncbi:uncharacterized protein LOC118965606 [Oncorhynchus mykiss]|uniref:uncharacterized protein LOC118965606 n=1 Tax=Oncorhynchus mykiss TaxID=8022 RepID=UPI001878486C|nr:uncharacterized protein LOC118965606 [Oncorhynchus mykiss]
MYQGMPQRPLALSKTVSQSCQEMPSSPLQLRQAPDMLFQKDPMTFQDPEKRVLPVQSCLKTFPRTQHGTTRKRAFNSSWYKDNSWLEYSVNQDFTYCFACRHLSLHNTPESAFTLQSGFCNWKKVTFKNYGFKLHSKAENHCKISIQTVCKIQPKTSLRFYKSLMMSTVGQKIVTKVMVRASNELIFYQVLDSLTAELQRRFSKKNCEIMQGIQTHNPKSTTFLNEEPLFSFAQTFESDLEDLKHEVHQTKWLLDRREKSGRDRLSTLLDLVVFLEPYKEVFHELFPLCNISVVTPVNSASCERSFLALQLIKTHLKTTMVDDRLSHLGILSVESKRACSLNMFVKHLASSHQNRRIMLF